MWTELYTLYVVRWSVRIPTTLHRTEIYLRLHTAKERKNTNCAVVYKSTGFSIISNRTDMVSLPSRSLFALSHTLFRSLFHHICTAHVGRSGIDFACGGWAIYSHKFLLFTSLFVNNGHATTRRFLTVSLHLRFVCSLCFCHDDARV